MLKKQLIEKLANRLKKLSTHDITLSVTSIIDKMSEAISHGNRIEIRGFGTFCLHYLQPRKAHNPRTGKNLITEAQYRPHFKPGKELRKQVDKGASKK